MKLVLLPGLDGTGELFEPFLQALPITLKVQVIAYPNREQNYTELTEFVLSQLPNEDFVLLGESFSGYIAYQVALQKPAHLRKVVFVASFITTPRPWLLRAFNTLSKKLLAIRPPSLLIKWFLLDTADKATVDLFLQVLKSVSPQVLAYRLEQIAQLPNSSNNSCEVPAVYLQADRDFLVPKQKFTDIKSLFSNLVLIKIDGPHFILQAMPQDCAEKLVPLLS